MAKVLVVVKVYPSGIEVDLDSLAKAIGDKLPEGYEITRYDKEPIAFGLSALRLYILMPEDVEGGTTRLEELIQGIDGVEELEIEAVHRISEY
ncbi:MAG: elongation factor 1-beta [Pyrodictiaceae archaeon]